jgi:hypothetical protein
MTWVLAEGTPALFTIAPAPQRKINMKFAPKTRTVMIVASVAASSFLGMSAANAAIIRDPSCSASPYFYIQKASAPQYQCFAYNGSGSRTLLVNDWYQAVFASAGMTVTVTWREQYTGAPVVDTGNGYITQPHPNGDPNYLLATVVVD